MTWGTPIASQQPGGGEYPSLQATGDVRSVACPAGVASSEIDTGIVAGWAAVRVWLSDWSDVSICFYPVSGAVGVACPAASEWPPARIAGAASDGRGGGVLFFYVNAQRRFFRLLSGSGATARVDLFAASDGMLEYVGSFVQPADGQTLDVTGISGDSAPAIVLQYTVAKGAAAVGSSVTYQWQPNASAPGTAARTKGFVQQGAATSVPFDVGSQLHISTVGTTLDFFQGESTLLSVSGKARIIRNNFMPYASGAALANNQMEFVTSSGHWTDTATNITSWRLFSSHAAGVGAGSRIDVWRRLT